MIRYEASVPPSTGGERELVERLGARGALWVGRRDHTLGRHESLYRRGFDDYAHKPEALARLEVAPLSVHLRSDNRADLADCHLPAIGAELPTAQQRLLSERPPQLR